LDGREFDTYPDIWPAHIDIVTIDDPIRTGKSVTAIRAGRPFEEFEKCMKYRPEVDGLRALAVLPVIFYHAGWSAFAGGYIGVDVFFVISGYLITSIIIEDHRSHGFSIIKFYERRARRILPALFLMLAVCVPLAWLTLSAPDMRSFSRAVGAVSVFVSNILFWKQSGYFNVAAEFNPLIHTWSLAVEEQFYLFFPLFFVFILRFGQKRVMLALVGVCVCSFAAAQYLLIAKPVPAFFLLPTRAWELAIGSLVAVHRFDRAQSQLPHRMREVLGLLGLGSILFGVFAFNEKTPDPGIWMLLPTVGTALIVLFATSDTHIGKLLSTKPLVGIGLISYSAYLWHQPLFAFAREITYRRDFYIFALLAVVALLLAFLTWKYVETPVRKRSYLPRRTIFQGAFVLTAAFFAFGIAGSEVAQGFAMRPAAKNLDWMVYDIDHFGYRPCPVSVADPRFALDACFASSRGPASAAVVGDSHAEDKFYGIERLDTRRHWLLIANRSCPPIVGVDTATEGAKLYCREKFDEIANWLAAHKEVHTVFLSFFGNFFLETPYAADHILGGIGPQDLKFPTVGSQFPNRDEAAYYGLRQFVERLLHAGKQVVVAVDMPELPFLPKDCFQGRPNCEIQVNEAMARQRRQRQLLNRLARDYPEVRIFDPQGIVCGPSVCSDLQGTTRIYRDSHHLSRAGSDVYGRRFLTWLDSLQETPRRSDTNTERGFPAAHYVHRGQGATPR
jgi:peptidoglycan/LPS O-acetylase OafA/YrhL